MPPVISTATFREDGGAGAIETFTAGVVREAANNAEEDWVAQLSNRMFGKKPQPKVVETNVLGVVPEEVEAALNADKEEPADVGDSIPAAPRNTATEEPAATSEEDEGGFLQQLSNRIFSGSAPSIKEMTIGETIAEDDEAAEPAAAAPLLRENTGAKKLQFDLTDVQRGPSVRRDSGIASPLSKGALRNRGAGASSSSSSSSSPPAEDGVSQVVKTKRKVGRGLGRISNYIKSQLDGVLDLVDDSIDDASGIYDRPGGGRRR